MEITIYELLGMIKDGKTLKNVRIRYFDRNNDYCDECNLKENEIINRLYYGNIELNDEVEILEEEKKTPKKIDIQIQNETTGNAYIINEHGTKCYLTKHSKILANKINEIIDYLKSKGE